MSSARLAMVLLLFLFLATFRLGEPGTWSDEGYSLLEATGQTGVMSDSRDIPSYLQSSMYVADQIPLAAGTFRPSDVWRKNTPGNVLRATSYFDNGNGMSHALLLHFWIRAFGVSNQVVRLPSVLFGLGTIIVTYFLVSSFTRDQSFALLVASLASISPLLIRLSKTARAHGLAVLCVTASLYCLYRTLQDRNRRTALVSAVGYGCFAALAFHAHYFTAFALGVEAVFILIFCVRRAGGEGLYGRLAAASAVAVAVSSGFFFNGLLVGLHRGALQEQVRLLEQERRLPLQGNQQGPQTTLATIPNVVREGTSLVAHLFSIRSAVASTPWRAVRGVPSILLLLSLATGAVYVFGIMRGYAVSTRDERTLLWCAASIVAGGLACTTLMAVAVMKTIIPFSPRSHGWMIPCVAVLTAFVVRGVLTWSRAARYSAVAVLALQLLVFNAVSLRFVLFPAYDPDPQVRLPSGSYEASLQIRKLYRPGDVVRYERWTDAVRVNLYLHGFEAVQMVDDAYLQRAVDDYDEPRSIELVRPPGERIVLWRGIQNDGALLPHRQ